MQEGFNTGYKDSVDSANKVGQLWGKVCVKNAIRTLRTSEKNCSEIDTAYKDQQYTLATALHDFLGSKLQSCSVEGLKQFCEEDVINIERILSEAEMKK